MVKKNLLSLKFVTLLAGAVFAVSCIVAAMAVYTIGQVPAVNGNKATPPFECTKRINANDLKVLLDDVRAKNPEMIKRLDADAELRQKQVENLRQLLAFACQAVKDGVLSDPVNKSELENIRREVVATNFDKIQDKRPSHTPFASISDDRVAEFYRIAGNEAKFEDFLKVKVALLKRSNPEITDRKITTEEMEQAREVFAKIAISEADSKLKAQRIDPNFSTKTDLQVRLQQAQFLARIYSDANKDKTSVSENEIDEFIKVHPEFNVAEKKTKAEAILARAKAGEDFAALANEFSNDPGNLGVDGKKQGGLYADVPKGRMLAAFENAALALKPGEVSPALVETDYGYHIIKLDKKSEVKQPDGTSELTYDVRHILISTTQKDPENPAAREMPIKEFVRSQLETQKESKFVAKVVADNPVEIAAIPITPSPVKKQPVKHRRVKRSN